MRDSENASSNTRISVWSPESCETCCRLQKYCKAIRENWAQVEDDLWCVLQCTGAASAQVFQSNRNCLHWLSLMRRGMTATYCMPMQKYRNDIAWQFDAVDIKISHSQSAWSIMRMSVWSAEPC